MSECSVGDDLNAEYAFDPYYPFGLPSDTWTTSDGTEVKLTDMTENHIRSCMRIVGKNDFWFWKFDTELKRREFSKIGYTYKACFFYHDPETGIGCLRCSHCNEPWFPENDVSRFDYCPSCGYERLI